MTAQPTNEPVARHLPDINALRLIPDAPVDVDHAQTLAKIGHWRLDIQRNELAWSDETYRIFGVSKNTALDYEAFLAAVHPDDRDYVHKKWTAAMRGEPYDIEHRMVAGKTIKWVRERAELQFDANGALLGGVGTVQDITELRTAKNDLEHSLHRFELLAQTAEHLLQTREPQRAVEQLCTKVMHYLDCHAFFNFLVDEQAGRLRLNACAGIPSEESRKMEWLDFGVAVCGCAARDGRRIVAEHIPTTPDPRTDLVKSYGIKAYACHPLLGPGGKVLGTLSFGTHSRETYSESDLSMMKAVADQVSAAMIRVKHEQELEQRVAERTAEVRRQADQLRALTEELTQAEQRERKRVAAILHDHVQQLLVGALLQVTLIKRQHGPCTPAAKEVESIINKVISACRSLTVELSPPVLHQAGLAAGLKWLAKNVQENSPLRVTVNADKQDEPHSEDVRILLFESVRELLLNTLKHSGSLSAEVQMVALNDDCTRIEVTDDGKGFDTALLETEAAATSFGIFRIRERLAHVGGRMQVESVSGKGTRVTLIAPRGKREERLAASEVAAEAVDSRIRARRDTSQRITVLMVDDHQILRRGIAALLRFESDIEIVGEADDGEQAVEMVKKLRPQVVIMDVNMPVMDGVEATRIIRRERPDAAVIGLSMHRDPEIAASMREAGAIDFVSKGAPTEELVKAIRMAIGA